ncbi:efflux RND transporter permease subunit [Pseudodesulfovibrio sp.]|uniref:efflux RND transporter permease subunit n=1 Tax=Pseudodesulfovibrio sp. TaxID=2035812 RepID=UPI00262323BF|nr:efflux RND transporter permease subunit [Pseudodesulfovibrio sp.]MDD3311161.1 efflux RND transporter permease subunit [Pseudodesulfovibrio sp.]
MTTRPGRAERGAIAWMAGNSIAANLMMVLFLVGGLIFAFQVKQEVFPEFETDTVSISIAYPGASPEEVEQGVTLAVEQAVQGIEGVKEVTSTSSEGQASIVVEALEGANVQRLLQDVKSEVDGITSLPEEAEEPVISEGTHRRDVLSLMIYGKQDELALRELAEQLREELLASSGITQAELKEVSGLQISVEVPEAKLRAHNLTLSTVAETLGDAALDMPGGSIKTSAGEVLVRMRERRDWAHEFANIPVVTGPDGAQVLLGDIGSVADGFQDDDIITRYNGQPAVRLDVFRIGDQTPGSVAAAARKVLAEFELRLPSSVHVVVLNDSSEIFNQRMDLLIGNGCMGLVLVFILLAVFLDARLAFWVAMGIPVSFLGSFIALKAAGVSVNMISMFAFLIALGIVVDDAIVVGENVFTMRQQGMSPLRAAIRGAREIALPVVFSVLTNIVTFLPLMFIPGMMGKMMYCIPVVVISVFAVSLIESLFILPAHLAHVSERGPGRFLSWAAARQKRIGDGLLSFIRNVYRPFLDRCLTWRYVTLAAGVALLLLSAAYALSGRLGMTLMPRIESDYAYAMAELPYGSPVARTEAVRDKLLDAAERVVAVNGGDRLRLGTYAKIGGAGRDISGSHVVSVQIYLTGADTRPISTEEFVQAWRREAGVIPGLENLTFQSDQGGPGAGNELEIQLTHSDEETLKQAAAELAEALSYFPKVKDIDDGFSPGKQQLDFKIRPEGESLGLTAQDIASQVRAAYYGKEVLRQQRGRNEVKVLVRRPESERESEFDLEEFMVRTPDGKDVPLREVVDVTRGRAYTSIKHVDGRRSLVVGCDVTPRNEAGQVLTEVLRDAMPKLQARHPGLGYSIEGHQGDMSEGMDSLYTGLFLALLGIYALLAIPFKSYVQPIIIMVSIPFGTVGAVLGHLLMGYPLSLNSMLGIVALAGVVVNDSLVFIEYANRQRTLGHCAHDAVLEAGTARFRPIMLTTLTTFGGLAPMILETSRQAQFLIPMAISLGFGILFATGITLILVPALYMALEDVREGVGRLGARRAGSRANREADA